MAYEVSEGDIKVVRGDSFMYPITIRTESKLLYVACPADEIYFEVYSKYTDASPLFSKKIPYNDMMLKLSAKETSSMRYGDYVYVVRIKFHNGFVDSVLHGIFSVVVPGGA